MSREPQIWVQDEGSGQVIVFRQFFWGHSVAVGPGAFPSICSDPIIGPNGSPCSGA